MYCVTQHHLKEEKRSSLMLRDTNFFYYNLWLTRIYFIAVSTYFIFMLLENSYNLNHKNLANHFEKHLKLQFKTNTIKYKKQNNLLIKAALIAYEHCQWKMFIKVWKFCFMHLTYNNPLYFYFFVLMTMTFLR